MICVQEEGEGRGREIGLEEEENFECCAEPENDLMTL